MAKYQKYAEYKHSGIEWLGEIPSHWDMSKLRYLFNFSKGLTITKDNLEDEGIPCVSYGEVHSKYGFEVDPTKHPLKCVNNSYLKSSENALLNKGDFVFADTSEDLKGSGNFTHLVNDEKVFAGYHTVIGRPFDYSVSRFYAYLFDSKEFRSQIQLAVKGVKVFSITQAMLRAADVWLPSNNEKYKIANFLDHETAKIDSLIAKQEMLIELLKEKRQAVISHAVTKGLNPDVSMKDSGIEWADKLPAHWNSVHLKWISTIYAGGTPSKTIESYWENGTVPWINSGAVNQTYILEPSTYITKTAYENSSAKWIPKKALVMALAGQGKTKGMVAQLGIDTTCNQSMGAIIPNDLSYARYLFWWITANYQNIRNMAGGDLRDGLNLEHLGDIHCPLPTKDEIKKITSFLDHETEQIDSLIVKAESAIQLMKERRTALISSAVTGKIDVRNWQHPNEAKKGLSS